MTGLDTLHSRRNGTGSLPPSDGRLQVTEICWKEQSMKTHLPQTYPGGLGSGAAHRGSLHSRTARTVLLYMVDVVSGAACTISRKSAGGLLPIPVMERDEAGH